ncbi:uncharacterized protein LOC106656406 isoform X2 [Trichogramma pretiosum]|uniref:uncharacterized protein LOC106656406 isoform X2 n=1 Tax=Trichogramma pretiosum TaxID=7493 RepID=UPI000C719643|nr:uncharacterized protein LOC106656406 isoform X2 [Trichogramma pretiosum]
MRGRLMTEEYFRQKSTAVYIIHLVDYLNKNEITEENLDNKDILKDIILKGMGKKISLTTKDINALKEALCFFKIDELKKTNLYRINRGILAVACVEHVLYPGEDHRKHRTIYRCCDDQAPNLYKKLREHCGFTTEDELDPVIVKSTTSFFRSRLFTNNKTFLETVRSYLKTVNINIEEMIYIMKASIEFINNKKTAETVPWERYIVNREYFQKKGNADALINLVNYLENKEVKEEDIENEKILIDILREGMKKFPNRPPSKLQLEEFKKTIINLTIEYLTVTNLYRINRGILTVVCVEYALFPGQDYEEYKKIYDGNISKATALYKELCGIPKENKVNEALAKSARSFFWCRSRNLETIRLYLQNIDIDSEEIEYIKNASIQLISNEALFADKPGTNTISPIEDHPINVITNDEETLPPMTVMPLVQDMSLVVDQGLIISNKDELSTNMINLIEDHPINVTIDDEETLQPMLDMLLEHVDPTSVVPIPVDQGFLSRYSPNEVVLAKRFKSYFWPAKIIEVYSDKMHVTFFPVPEETEKEEVSSEEDVRAFTDEEIEAACASLCTGLSQEAFKNAVKFASAELN